MVLEPTLADDIKISVKPEYNSYGVYGGIDGIQQRVAKRGPNWLRYIDDLTISASSELKEERFDYSPANLRKERKLVWSEGVKGDGLDQWVELTLTKPQPIHTFSIAGGHQGSHALYQANNRPKVIELIFNDEEHKQTVSLADQMCDHDFVIKGYSKPVKTLKVVIKEIYKGSQHQDTCISHIELTTPLKKAPKRYGAR